MKFHSNQFLKTFWVDLLAYLGIFLSASLLSGKSSVLLVLFDLLHIRCHFLTESSGCPFEQDDTWNITWPATGIDQVATQKCPGGSETKGNGTIIFVPWY